MPPLNRNIIRDQNNRWQVRIPEKDSYGYQWDRSTPRRLVSIWMNIEMTDLTGTIADKLIRTLNVGPEELLVITQLPAGQRKAALLAKFKEKMEEWYVRWTRNYNPPPDTRPIEDAYTDLGL